MIHQNDYTEITSAILKNDWDEQCTIQVGKFSISQFQGTAFDSDYTCYKVQWFEWQSYNNIRLASKQLCSMVVKITETHEENILKMLFQKNFPVPKIYAILRSKNGNVIIFMENIPGQELYSSKEDSAWKTAITTLTKIHREYWTSTPTLPTMLPFSNVTSKKLKKAYTNTSHNSSWRTYMNIVYERFEVAPQTLIHGDMFPTNILVHQENCKFIDWANSGIAPYMMDVARLTAIIDKKTLLPMCPCSDIVIQEYFKNIEPFLKISYDSYLKDVYMAQFVELAFFYSPPLFYRCDKEYNQLIEQRLNEIVADYFIRTQKPNT